MLKIFLLTQLSHKLLSMTSATGEDVGKAIWANVGGVATLTGRENGSMDWRSLARYLPSEKITSMGLKIFGAKPSECFENNGINRKTFLYS